MVKVEFEVLLQLVPLLLLLMVAFVGVVGVAVLLVFNRLLWFKLLPLFFCGKVALLLLFVSLLLLVVVEAATSRLTAVVPPGLPPPALPLPLFVDDETEARRVDFVESTGTILSDFVVALGFVSLLDLDIVLADQKLEGCSCCLKA